MNIIDLIGLMVYGIFILIALYVVYRSIGLFWALLNDKDWDEK